MTIKILVYGHNGYIGRELIKYFKNVEIITTNTRCNDMNSIENDIIKYKPERILYTAGRTCGNGIQTIDYLEHPDTLNINLRDNLYSPIITANICNKYNIHMTYIGTGCIYKYDNEHTENNLVGYKESDKPNFFGSNYSIVKGYTDNILSLYKNVLNLRIRMPLNNNLDDNRNLLAKLLKYNKICSITNSITVTKSIYPLIVDMCIKKYTGTYNMVNPEPIEHKEIIDIYNGMVLNKKKYKLFTLEEKKEMSKKRSNCVLNTNKLTQLYPNIKNTKEAIIETLRS